MANEGIQLGQRHGLAGEGVTQQVCVPMLDVALGVDDEVARVVTELVPEGSSSENIVGAVEREPAVRGRAEACHALRQPGDTGEEGIVVAAADGAEGGRREHDPRELAYVLARGRAPCAAHGTEAGAVGRKGEAGDDPAEDLRQEVPRWRRHRRDLRPGY